MGESEHPSMKRQTANIATSFLERMSRDGQNDVNPDFLKTPPASSLWQDKDNQESLTEQDGADFSNIFAKDLLPANNGEEPTMRFLMEVFEILLNYIRKTFDRTSKVLDFHHPHQFLKGMEGFTLELPDHPESLEQILVDCRDTLKYGVKTGHPRFFNQLSSGLDVVGLVGEWLTSTANTNMFTFEIAPVFTIMEEVLLKKMSTVLRWSHDESDGIFLAGGAMSNLYSILAARYKRFPEVKTQGVANFPRMVLFTSELGHYSIMKGAMVLGIGTDNVIPVKCNSRGKIISAELEASIIEAKQKAAWGGGLLMSQKHRYKLTGIERANSVTWNPHKIMGVPLQCSAILIHEKGLLQDCNKMGAQYLFQNDKLYDVSYDTGDKTILCGRHVDVFKFWLMWKAKGTSGFEKQINKCLELAEYLHSKLKRRNDFKLVFDDKPEHTNVCFWYIPPSLQEMPESAERDSQLHQVAPKIKGRMMEEGSLMVGYQPQGHNVNFFRMVFSNPATNKSDVDFLIEELARLGKDL
ncbi:glutamate decarboxylase 1-like isoform X2 [Hemiscyllium ocellatum]|uniref:glutamate decarboxylase 1-like isoform X2 n=1 Tax=Hemiscyllium ocellatum TaxID=170820 RepID=UPI0029668D6D|nr:glutamate decarboxylase 1-like isoform X2 [Hemiscyllium ocellatum]